MIKVELAPNGELDRNALKKNYSPKIISSPTSWVLYEAIVLSVLCSSQRNKEPFEAKKAKSISRASEYRCKPAASRRGSAVVTSDKCKLAASRRGSAVVSSARVI